MNREFSSQIRRHEWLNADCRCRICGSNRSLESAHILARSQKAEWRRQGTNSRYWASDKHVSSLDNCICLCHTCHRRIDSIEGRLLCNVGYLTSLKSNHVYCSALIKESRGETHATYKRCSRLRRKKSMRCSQHSLGGVERIGSPGADRNDSSCIII